MPTAQPRRAPSGDDAHDMPDGLVRCVHCGISLTVDELIANSISTREAQFGRPLDADEKAEIAAKVKQLMKKK